MASFSCVLHLRLLEHALPKIAAKIFRRPQIDFSPTEKCGHFPFHASDTQQARDRPGFKVDQHVHIRVGTKIRVQDRPKQRQAPDVMLTAERGDLPLIDHYLHHRPTCSTLGLQTECTTTREMSLPCPRRRRAGAP